MDFRRIITALTVLVLFAGLAAAQTTPFTCAASTSVPPTVRYEGITELVGDIVLTCTGGSSANAAQANFTVFTNAGITSRLIGSGTATNSANATEALLLIDEPGSTGGATPVPCVSNVFGCPTTQSPLPNVYQGVWGAANPNSITFFGVPVIPPGSTGTRTFRITNVRINANALSNSNVPTPITAFVSINSPSSVAVSNPNQIVGYVQAGLTTSLRKNDNSDTLSPTTFQQCANQNTSSSNRALGAFAYLRYTENFGTAFKTRTTAASPATVPGNSIPGAISNNSESGFIFNGLNNGSSAIPGLADSGTRFKAVFNNIPAGVRIWVTTTNVGTAANVTAPPNANAALGTSSYAVLISGETVSDTNFFPVTASGSETIRAVTAAEISVVNGQAVAVWEVTNSNPNTLENFDFGVALQYTASAGTNSPVPGTTNVNLSFAPTSTVTTATTGPIPRFADTSTAKAVFSIGICRTVLLFPFVTNQAGFDTGLAISNTSTDPFGTTPQAGPCQLNAYGANPPAQAITSASVASGSTYTTLASSALPGFQGYVIAVCNFQYAHGFAFISDLGARNLAMGYLAEIIPDPGTGTGGRSASGIATGSGSEILGY